MRLIYFLSIVALLTLVNLTGAQAAPLVIAPTSQPTATDVQTLIDAREYAAAIKLSTKMLGLRGATVAGMNRFEITMLKGDAQAGQKSLVAAITTYKSAGTETQDPQEQAISKWTAELFRTAGSTMYTPRMVMNIPRRGPFNLLIADQRKAGFEALLDDNLSALEPKLKVASASQSLVQIWPVIQQVVDLSKLDEIANGSDDKTTAIASGLLDHSRNLLSNVLKEYWARLGDIDTHANTTTASQNQGLVGGVIVTQTISQKNGLSDSNKSELKDMMATCHKIHDATEQLMKFSKNQQDWNPILSDANRVAGRASDVLNTDYSGVVSQTGNDGYNNTGYGNGTGIVGNGTTYGGGGGRTGPTSRPTRKTSPTTRP